MRRLLLALTLLLSCAEQPPLPPGPEDPAANLAQLDAFADRAQSEAMIAAWRSATEASAVEAKPFGVLPLLLLKDDEVAALAQRLPEAHQQRCLQAIHSVAVRMQSEADPDVAKVLAQIAPLRTRVDDSQTAQALEPLIRQVIAARNAWAARRSQSKYLELMQRHRGYDPETAARLEAQVRSALPDPRDAAPAIPDEPFDEAHNLERAAFVFELLRLPRNPPALQIRDVRQSPFATFGFYAIDPPHDQGVTVRPGAGIDAQWSAFHEFGHAAMSLMATPSSCRTTRRAVSPAVSESCAKVAERLVFAEEWLASQGLPLDGIAGWERHSELTRMHNILTDIEVERGLYDDPASEQPGGWALKRHLAFEPLERVDYLLARCAQAAIYRRLRALPGGLLGEPAREVLREQVFRGATELRFEEWFRRATGTEPDCGAWLDNVRH